MADPGDHVEVTSGKKKEEGILMPSQDKSIVLIKLDTGYNIGFQKSKAKVKVLKKAPASKSKKEKLIKNKNLPTIAILHTGGTIASKVDYRTGGAVSDFSPEELVSIIPELKKMVNIESELIAQMWSDDLRFKHFELIAQAIEKQVKKGVKGIIIGMGTDNLAVASAAMSFIVESSPVPILFVGAQRSSDRGSSDAAMNVICATEFILKSDFGGIGICMHASSQDDFCSILPGTKTYKLHSSRRDAFKAINAAPIATINYKNRQIKYNTKEYIKRSKELTLKPKMEDKVGLLKIHIHMFPEQIEFYKGYKGLIIEGTGLGHTPGQVPTPVCTIHKKFYPAFKKLIDSGCVVVMTTQCLFGALNMNVYDKGRDLLELGIIPGKDMLANTAFVKLAWLLANDKKNAARLMGENLRGEINAKITYEKEFI